MKRFIIYLKKVQSLDCWQSGGRGGGGLDNFTLFSRVNLFDVLLARHTNNGEYRIFEY